MAIIADATPTIAAAEIAVTSSCVLIVGSSPVNGILRRIHYREGRIALLQLARPAGGDY